LRAEQRTIKLCETKAMLLEACAKIFSTLIIKVNSV
jgi:hypothetical protein